MSPLRRPGQVEGLAVRQAHGYGGFAEHGDGVHGLVTGIHGLVQGMGRG
jgi:hypothetical protein